jgi:hypothetical protein
MENSGCLAEKFDRDFGRDFIHRFLYFVGGPGQPVGVDVDPDATTRTSHVLVRLDPPDGLLEILPAIGTLKSDLMHFSVRHGGKRHLLRHTDQINPYYLLCSISISPINSMVFRLEQNIVVAGPRFLRNQS